MNKILLSAVILCLLVTTAAEARVGSACFVPRVSYKSPACDSTIDLTGKQSFLFSWDMLPIPSGNRDSYRVVIIKEPNAGAVFNQVIDPRTFSVEVPASIFENGCRYSWHVRQRDGKTFYWSEYDIWYFNVVKK